jgi:hypothetical protein
MATGRSMHDRQGGRNASSSILAHFAEANLLLKG